MHCIGKKTTDSRFLDTAREAGKLAGMGGGLNSGICFKKGGGWDVVELLIVALSGM